MPLIPLAIPPGQYRNGTDLQAAGRWRDANLVRWVEGTMRPIGGWRLRQTVGTAPIRAALGWRDLSGDRRFATGSFNALFSTLASGASTDITPVDLAIGDVSAVANTGYGGGVYGAGTYGTPRADNGTIGEATTWSLDNWGEFLLACSTADGRILEWQLNPALNAVPIPAAPINCSGLVVTEERFVFALGAGGNPRRVAWSDREDNTVWAPLVTNEAGDIELQTSGQIMLGIRTRGQTLILTDQDAHSATYQGSPFIYNFQRVGSACGVASRKAAASVDEGVFWMGQRGFHVYSGGSVMDLPCEVSDYVFSDMNQSQRTKVFAMAVQAFNEVWWFYPSGASLENDRYVVFNYSERHWSTGNLSRTAGFDGGVFQSPMMFCDTGCVFDHEVGLSHDGAVPFAETGPISLGNGDQVMSATMLIPDEKTQGDVSASFKTRFHPNDVERVYGPYAMASPTDVRFTGRQVRMRVEAARLADWRVGVMRLQAKAGGLR